ncbi:MULTISPECIES: DUF418 domain-containing protein [unclassified Novosphingobium]|uniref:DUF418 domain-containing protein n=1 Tax=unclassified Novosphingobium TaxID=2644732 RepID=UPI00135C5A3B|nr:MULTISPECIES: DUF418 domain-containing protein [unclassified Novosphingobium]
MAGKAVQLDPVRGRARIDVLDVMRGIAILGILYMNIPFMATNPAAWMDDIRRLSWSAADRATWTTIEVFWNGTQRGLFEFLFGAGVMVFTAKAMRPDDPVAVADLYYRRNLLLVAFGLIDIFLVAWIGDILLAYGLSALFLFPFRKAPAKVLLAMGMGFAAFVAVSGASEYSKRIEMIHKVESLEARQTQGAKLNGADKKILADWQEKREAHDLSKPPSKKAQAMIDAERKAHVAGPWAFLKNNWGVWNKIFGDGNGTFFTVLEAVCAMFIGMALWKWGVIQGERSVRFYAVTAVAAYGLGCGLRAWGVAEIFAFDLAPKPGWITDEFARLAVTLGHVALFNLAMKTGAGRSLLAPFKAVGRMAFSIYVLTSVVTLWFIFAPWGLNLWDRFGWAQLALAATVINVFMLVFANVWMRFFVSGPLEWVWRSLAYGKRQPFARRPAEPSMGTLAPA